MLVASRDHFPESMTKAGTNLGFPALGIKLCRGGLELADDDLGSAVQTGKDVVDGCRSEWRGDGIGCAKSSPKWIELYAGRLVAIAADSWTPYKTTK